MNDIIKLIQDNFPLTKEELDILSNINYENINSKKILNILNNLIKFRLDLHSIFAYLFYELNLTPSSDIDNDIKNIYDSLKFNFQITSEMSTQEQADVLRKMFIAMNKDVRVIVIKLYIMLFDISQYEFPLTKQQHQNLINVREIYAPLAERLGLNSLKSELEDCCLKNLNPKIYAQLADSIILQKDENFKIF